jgi:hypothetical protein
MKRTYLCHKNEMTQICVPGNGSVHVNIWNIRLRFIKTSEKKITLYLSVIREIILRTPTKLLAIGVHSRPARGLCIHGVHFLGKALVTKQRSSLVRAAGSTCLWPRQYVSWVTIRPHTCLTFTIHKKPTSAYLFKAVGSKVGCMWCSHEGSKPHRSNLLILVSG